MRTRPSGVYCLLLVAMCLLAVSAGAAMAQESKSAPLAKQLADLLDKAKTDAIAAKEPGEKDHYVAALYFAGSQLLVIEARYSVPVLLDEKLAKRARSVANHGRVEVSPYADVPAHNVYTRIGYNYRMTALQAAMGLVQLGRLDKFIEKRRKNADYLARHIKKIRGLKPAFVRKDVKHVYWVYGALVVDEELGITRDRFRRALLAEGINSEGYCPIPVHLQVFFRKKHGYGDTAFPFESPWDKEKVTYKKGLCPKAEKLSSQDLLLPVYQTLSERDLKDVVTALEKVADNAERLRD